jgi:long-chain fatty acid transport protein
MSQRVSKLTKTIFKLTALALAFAPASAFATLGYFAHGFGLKAKGMGGVGIALPQDSLAPATNPAGNAWIGTRFDGELEWFRPIREAEIVGNANPPFGPGRSGTYDASGRKDFLIPGLGYNYMVNKDLALGIAMFGNGGMNTTFNNNPFGGFMGGSAKGGVDYMQLFIAPTIAYKLNENHSIGATLNLVYHQFGAQGLEGFDNPFFSSKPGSVTNRGRDDATGASLRLGWTGKIAPAVTLGATYQTKTHMGKLDKYGGLFRNGGELDVPENYGIGIAVDATPKLKIAADILQINYAKLPAVGTTSDCLLLTGTCQLGASNGPGFGWRNATAYKFGVSYDLSQSLTLRAGYATTKQPIPTSQTMLNILFPAVVQDHVTLGATLQTGKTEVTVGYMHAIHKTVSGAGSIPLAFGGGNANLKMYQDSLGIGVGYKF